MDGLNLMQNWLSTGHCSLPTLEIICTTFRRFHDSNWIVTSTLIGDDKCFWENRCFKASRYVSFMERKGSWSYSQEPAIGPYPEPDEFSWHPHMLWLTTWSSVLKKLLGRQVVLEIIQIVCNRKSITILTTIRHCVKSRARRIKPQCSCLVTNKHMQPTFAHVIIWWYPVFFTTFTISRHWSISIPHEFVFYLFPLILVHRCITSSTRTVRSLKKTRPTPLGLHDLPSGS
jgi:hypothetical protein